MVTYLRYDLAAVCFAASVGCLALWWRSFDIRDTLVSPLGNQPKLLFLMSDQGDVSIHTVRRPSRMPASIGWRHLSKKQEGEDRQLQIGKFRIDRIGVSFPLWYPSLIFAVAGVAVLRFRRQFSIRSAMVAVSVVAALLGMAVIL